MIAWEAEDKLFNFEACLKGLVPRNDRETVKGYPILKVSYFRGLPTSSLSASPYPRPRTPSAPEKAVLVLFPPSDHSNVCQSN